MSYSPLGKEADPSKLLEGLVAWRSPSNIALVKYWGKFGNQEPRNPSISFTLESAHTETEIAFAKAKDTTEISLKFLFEDQENEAFEKKIHKFLTKNISYFPWIKQLDLQISSHNSFPHSSGIASSASSMSALIMCLMDIEAQIFDTEISLQKASFLSRLASGSASRSVYPELAVWGANENIESSNNLFAIPFQEMVDPIFTQFHDDILIVSDKEKSVSSTAGHALMDGNIYAENRYTQANQNILELIAAMKTGDLKKFGAIVESEALTLHALMMSSTPSYMLMAPNTISIIEELRAFRALTQHDIYFTLDAGPNIHLLYPDAIAKEAQNFVEDKLVKYCVNGRIIKDRVGSGPKKLK